MRLKHAPLRPAVYDEAGRKARELFDRETRRAGNPVIDITADWIDYEAAGANDMTQPRRQDHRDPGPGRIRG